MIVIIADDNYGLHFLSFSAVLSDVDLIPEDDRAMYSCPISPRHLSVAVDKFNYR